MENISETKNFLKKDLIKVAILVLIFCATLIFLKMADNRGGYITDLAGKITSFFIRA